MKTTYWLCRDWWAFCRRSGGHLCLGCLRETARLYHCVQLFMPFHSPLGLTVSITSWPLPKTSAPSSILQFRLGFVHEHATEVKYVIVGVRRLFFFFLFLFSSPPPLGKMLEGNHSVQLCCLLLKWDGEWEGWSVEIDLVFCLCSVGTTAIP